MIEVVAIDTPSLGDRSYLVTDGTVALVVDPQRDIDRILVAAADRGVAVTGVFETHIHNDYVSGGLALAGGTGAAYHVNRADDVALRRTAIGDGEVIVAGALRARVLATPGHTWTHLSYVVTDAGAGEVAGVFTGGSLLHGSTGRPDLIGTRHAPALAAAQHASARRLASLLPGHTPVYPTHGFGSFCAVGPAPGGPARVSTIEQEQRTNPVLTLDEDRYVAAMLAGLDVFPGYYARMGPANAFGADAPALLPPPCVLPGQVPRRVAARGLGGGPARPPRLRGRACTWFAQLPARRRVRHAPGLAAAGRGQADPARQYPGPGRGRAAGTGQDRRGPDRRSGHRHARGLAGR